MSDEATAAGEDTLTFNLKLTAAPSSPRIPITTLRTATGTQLRSQASTASKIPLDSLKMIFRGRLIKNNDTNLVVTEFKLENGNVIHCMGKPKGLTATSQREAAQEDPLPGALATLKSSNSSTAYLTAIETLEKVLTNITAHPTEDKYRRVKKKNAAFQRRLGGLSGGDAAMKAVGFNIETVEGEECYLMSTSEDAWPELIASKDAVSLAVSEAKRANSNSSAWTGMGFPGVMHPAVERNISEIVWTTQEIQEMLQDPRFRHMMQSHPLLRGHLAELDAIPNDIIELLMRDPNTRRVMLEAMTTSRERRGGNRGTRTARNSRNGGANSNNSTDDPAAGTGESAASRGDSRGGEAGMTDEELTEEEMIAQVLARSMRER